MLKHNVWFMMITSFIIQFVIMSLIMTNTYSNITFSMGKFYISFIMALLMGLIEVVMFDIHLGVVSLYYYLGFGFLLIIFVYAYRNQMYIDDKEYLKEMIEHHSMAILTSEEILQKTTLERVRKLAENIISTQEKEIDYMKQLLQ